MLFSVEHDSGSSIKAYVVPDGGGTVPSVLVRSNNAELLKLSANDSREQLVQAGRHSTGLCGFLIDESHIPDLASYIDLEILEAESGLLIYRRPVPGIIPNTNIFRLETHLLPLWRIDDALRDRFQYWYKGIDRQGRETSTQVFCIHNGNSSFVSGRLLVKTVEYYLNKGFKSIAMFRDPYHELAERLIILKNIKGQTSELLGLRDAMTFAPVIEYLAEFDQFDDFFCKRFFKRAPEEVSVALANPFVRQLTASTPDEMPSKSSIATALDMLANFEVIGLRSEASEFSLALTEMLNLEPNIIPVMNEYERVIQLGGRLREIRDVEALLEHDLEVYFHTARAFGSLTR